MKISDDLFFTQSDRSDFQLLTGFSPSSPRAAAATTTTTTAAATLLDLTMSGNKLREECAGLLSDTDFPEHTSRPRPVSQNLAGALSGGVIAFEMVTAHPLS